MIYTFNAKDYLRYPVMKEAFNLSDEDVFETISSEFSVLQKRLSLKNIDYSKLKGALIPNQDEDKNEICLVFDSSYIEESDYGYRVFDALIPLLDKQSTYSILSGDYIDLFNSIEDSQILLNTVLTEVLFQCNQSRYRHSEQYYLVYFNRLSHMQRKRIVEGLTHFLWFVGYADLTRESVFKTYLSNILVHSYVKCGKKIVAAHSSDYSDEDNINMRGFPFEKYGYELVSINEESFNSFLSYKIEAIFPDEKDVSFSFNALFPKFDTISKLRLIIEDRKWNDYLTSQDPQKKGKLLQTIGYGPEDKERFIKGIFKKICAGYIFNLRENEHDDLLFNACVDLPTVNGNYRRTTIALKYYPDSGEIHVVTVT